MTRAAEGTALTSTHVPGGRRCSGSQGDESKDHDLEIVQLRPTPAFLLFVY